jgi:ribonuclease P protein component
VRARPRVEQPVGLSVPQKDASTGRFGRNRRMRRRDEVQRVFDAGVRIHGRYLRLLMAPAPGSQSRLGIVASKKLGGAVARNRAKRLIREVFRHYPPQAGCAVDLVVIPRRELLDAPYSGLADDFRAVCRRATSRLPAAGDRKS